MAESVTRLLLVDDDRSFAGLVSEFLALPGVAPYRLEHVSRLTEAVARLQLELFDLVLLDLTLPDSRGVASCSRVRHVAPTVPIVILTGTDDEKIALEAVREGAQDYLVKGQIDAPVLFRSMRYAIERKRAEESLRQSEEFFRLISENVTDLIAVIDSSGRRIYNSPSYAHLLGEPAVLKGSDSFGEIHPDDRERIKRIFVETLATGVGQRAEYRMITPHGIRHIESLGSVIRDGRGKPARVVVVARDMTERKETIEVLRQALADLNKTHDELQLTQRQLIEAERVQAVSTFAAGVAHEVKNPLQTIILGVDYLGGHLPEGEATCAMVLREMGEAVQRADAIIRGLMEFASSTTINVREENLNSIIEQSIRSVETELAEYPVQLVQNLAPDLPPLKLEARVMKHVFINLLLYALRSLDNGGRLAVATCARAWTGPRPGAAGGFSQFKVGDSVVVAEVECAFRRDEHGPITDASSPSRSAAKSSGLGLTVLKKLIELYGGAMDSSTQKGVSSTYSIIFRV